MLPLLLMAAKLAWPPPLLLLMATTLAWPLLVLMSHDQMLLTPSRCRRLGAQPSSHRHLLVAWPQ